MYAKFSLLTLFKLSPKYISDLQKIEEIFDIKKMQSLLNICEFHRYSLLNKQTTLIKLMKYILFPCIKESQSINSIMIYRCKVMKFFHW